MGVGSWDGGEEIAEKFNNYFISIGPSRAENIDSNGCNYSQFVNRVDSNFHFHPLSSSQVYDLFNSLFVCKATGIDKVSAKVLKWAAPVVSESLMQVLTGQLSHMFFQLSGKCLKERPFHKNGTRNNM